jgi:hypothetical protein
MTIRNQSAFDRNPAAGFDGLFDWDWMKAPLLEATGRPIEPMDIDAHVEVNGQHLVIETKEEGKAVPGGQRRALLSLWARVYHMVIFLVGKRCPVQAEIWYPRGSRRQIGGWDLLRVTPDTAAEMTKQDLIEEIRAWATWAEKRPNPFQYQGK